MSNQQKSSKRILKTETTEDEDVAKVAYSNKRLGACFKSKSKTPRKKNLKKINIKSLTSVDKKNSLFLRIMAEDTNIRREEEFDFVGFEEDDISCKIKNIYITLQNILKNNVEGIVHKQPYVNIFENEDEEMEDMLHLTKEQYLSNLKISKIKDPVPILKDSVASEVKSEKKRKNYIRGKRGQGSNYLDYEVNEQTSENQMDVMHEKANDTPLSQLFGTDFNTIPIKVKATPLSSLSNSSSKTVSTKKTKGTPPSQLPGSNKNLTPQKADVTSFSDKYSPVKSSSPKKTNVASSSQLTDLDNYVPSITDKVTSSLLTESINVSPIKDKVFQLSSSPDSDKKYLHNKIKDCQLSHPSISEKTSDTPISLQLSKSVKHVSPLKDKIIPSSLLSSSDKKISPKKSIKYQLVQPSGSDKNILPEETIDIPLFQLSDTDAKIEKKIGSNKERLSDLNPDINSLYRNSENKLTDLNEMNNDCKVEQNYPLIDSKHPSEYDFAKTCTSKNDGMFEIPGLSYIIGIKPDSSSLKASYDCVMCNCKDASVTFSGPEMKSHVQSRKHVMNVMLVENPALYEQYRKDLQMPTKALLNEILKYESGQVSQKIVSATLETYADQREKVIFQLRTLLSRHLTKQEGSLKDHDILLSSVKQVLLHVNSIPKKFKKLSTRSKEGQILSTVKILPGENDVDIERKFVPKSDTLDSQVSHEDSFNKVLIVAKGPGIVCEVPNVELQPKKLKELNTSSNSNLSKSDGNVIQEDTVNKAEISKEEYSLPETKVKKVVKPTAVISLPSIDNKCKEKLQSKDQTINLKSKDINEGNTNRSVDKPLEKTSHEINKGKYEQVVIIGDELYLPYLFILQKQPGVKVHTRSNFQITDLDSFISKDAKHSTKTTLYLFIIGIHSIAKINRSKACLDAECRFPLDALHLTCVFKKVLPQSEKFVENLENTLKTMKTLLPKGSDIAILPPLPIVLHDSRDHHSLHKRHKLFPLFKLFNFERDLTKWYPEWFEMMFKVSYSSLAELSKEFNCLDILDKLNTEEYRSFKSVMYDKKVDQCSYYFWKNSVRNIVISTLKDVGENMGSHDPCVKSDNLHGKMNVDSFFKNSESHSIDLSSKEGKRQYSFKKLIECDHLVFIGNANSLKLIPDIRFCSYSQWHFDYITQNSSNLISKLRSLEKEAYKKVLFIILSDVSMIGLEETNPECLVKKCEHLLTYTKALNPSTSVMSLIKSVVDSVKKVIFDIEKYGKFDLKVFVAPFTPRIYVLISNIIIFHSKMHATFNDQICIRFLRGSTKKVWEDVLNRFSTEWKNMALNMPHKDSKEKIQIRKIISESNANCPITWKDLSAEIFVSDYSAMSIWKHCIVSLAKCAWNKSFEFSRNVSENRSIGHVLKSMVHSNSASHSVQLHRSKLESRGPLSNSTVNTEKEFGVVPTSYATSSCSSSGSFSTPSFATKYPPPQVGPPFQANYPPLPFIPSFPPPILSDSTNNSKRPNSNDFSKVTYPHIPVSYPPPNSYLTKISQNANALLKQGSPSHSNFDNATESNIDLKNIMTPVNTNKFISANMPNLEDDITSKSSMNRDPDEIIQFARTIQNNSKTANLHSYSSMFNNVFIVGPRGLINPLLECNVKSTMIYHNFASFEDSDIQTLLYQMGDLQQKSVCCLVFDFSVIATKLIMSSGCAQQSCQQPIFVVALKTEPNPSETMKIEQLIHNQIQIISKFIRKLSQHIPVIILPLWPTRIYCEETSPNHHNSHTISNLGFPVVYGSKSVWKIAIRALIPSWNTLMELTNRNYDSCNYISSYIASNPKTFIILDNIGDFMMHWTELDIWKAFTETLLLSLVPMKSTGTFCSSSKSISASKSDKVDVIVTHVSSAIPSKFFEELFYSADRHVFIIPDKDKYTLKGMTPGRANLLVKKLNRYRIGDTVLSAHVMVDMHRKHPTEYDYSEFNLLQCLYISAIFEKVYKKWKREIINNLENKVNDVLDFVKLKTIPCARGSHCREPKLCPNYHNSLDIRRDPYEITYSDTLCMQQRRRDGICHNGLKCSLSHNVYEIKFHPLNYQIKICSSGNSSEVCNGIDLCNYAHKDSPELFYTNDWEDLTIIGPDHALKFFAGAIRGVRKLKDVQRPCLKVLLISPSKEFLDIAIQATASLSKSCGLMAGLLDENINFQDYYQILVGSPSVFSHLNVNNFLEKRGAIIVDDIQSILENDRHREEMRHFLHSLSCSRNAVFNKVFACISYDPRSTSLISDVAGLKLKLVYALPTDLQMMTSSVGHNTPHWISHPPASSAQLCKPSSFTHSNWGSSTENPDRNWAGSNYQDLHSRNSRFSDSDFSQHKRSRSRSSSPSHSKRQRVAEMSINTHPSEHTINEIDFPNLDIENDLSKRFGKKLFEEYSNALETMRQGFENEFAKYSASPEIYPNYETYYESFTAMYDMQHVSRPPHHKEKLWRLFWKSKFDDIKKEDWLLKERILREDFEEKLHLYSASLQHIIESGNAFSFVETLSLIEDTCDYIGFLGPSVKAMIQSCRNLGSSTKESYKMFTESENVMLVNMVLEKLKSLAQSATGNNQILYTKAIDWIPRFLDEAKRGPETAATPLIENLNIDLNAIAKASFGKGSKFALDLIKTAILYEGISNPSKEVINDLFLKVCAIHFTLSMD